MSYFLRSPIRTNKGREATETEGLESLKFDCCVFVCVCVCVCPDCISDGGIETAYIIEIKTNFQMLL